MSEWEEEAGESALGQRLRGRFRALARSAGPCPDVELLLQFADRQAASDVEEALARHIAGCGHCHCFVERIRGGIPAETPVATPALPAGLRAAERRLEKRFGSFLDQQRGAARNAPRRPPAWLAILWRPAAGYAVAALAIACAWLGVLPARRAVQPAAPLAPPVRSAPATIPGLVLDAERAAAGAVRLADPNQPFFLDFSIPILPGFRYSAEITTESGSVPARVAELTSWDGMGNFRLLCPPGLLSSGKYRLTVTEHEPATGQPRRSFAFEFSL